MRHATAGSKLLRGHEAPDGWEERARERLALGRVFLDEVGLIQRGLELGLEA